MPRIKVPLAIIVVLCLFASVAPPAHMQDAAQELVTDEQPDVPAAKKAAKSTSNKYVVRMADDPVVAYKGSVRGLRATKPAKGEKINPNSPEVVNYVSYLDSRHDAAMSRAGGGRKVYDYRYTFNGFTAELTPEQALKLAAAPGVISIEADEAQHLDTSTTVSFLGLDAPAGLWDQLGGVNLAGEDVIVGVVDTGVWPEHPSFSDRTGVGPNGLRDKLAFAQSPGSLRTGSALSSQEGKLAYHQIPGWHGKCVPGEAFAGSDCNQKLIGAQYFYEGSGLERIIPEDYISARDYNSHGSHTASTAAGNRVQADGLFAAFGAVSGMAPRARVAAYKVCWDDGNPATGDCFNSDSVAAIDQAVADGVDVINFSIGGSTTSFLSAVQVAFLFAADAGVFVAASAGNSGPTAGTVAHPGPWLTTVAAATHPRSGDGSVTLGNGVNYAGLSLTLGVGPAPLVYASDVGVAGADPNLLRQCTSGGLLDPAKVAGKIVLCERGGAAPNNARVDKSFAVQQAGGVGTIVGNIAAGATLNADVHFTPAVHVDNISFTSIKSYVASQGAAATATIAQGVPNMALPAPLIASFSSRGPSAATGDQLKPDVAAPGQEVLAAVSPVTSGGASFALFNGTSMSSPHVAGLAALLRQRHPDWSPMMIKSALMTTGANLQGLAAPTTLAFAQGAGHVRPNNAANPGLVYDHGFNDWIKFLCGTGQLTPCAPADIVDPSNLNLPSIAVGDLTGPQTVTRTVKNVSDTPATYTASFTGFNGISAVVSPSSFTIQPGESKTYTVTFAWANAPTGNNAYQAGFLTWTGTSGHVVRSPVVVRPIALLAPAAVAGAGTTGSTSWNITTGYNGALNYVKRGMIPAVTSADSVQDDPTNTFNTANPSASQGIKAFNFNVPAGTTLARFALFDDSTDGDDDLDLFVYRNPPTGAPVLVGTSNSVTSAETVSLTNPVAGSYTVYVHGWQTDETAGGPGASFTLFSWLLGTADAGNMAIAGPATVTAGATNPVNLSWTGLLSGRKYLGTITYTSGPATIGTTVVRVDTP